MKTELMSISKIFTERLFRIPDYQRGYAWGKKELRDFWNDLEQLQESKSHYCGVLMLEDVPSESVNKWEQDLWIIRARSYQPFYVVDGQQRLTTTIILIQAMLEALGEGQSLNFLEPIEIQKKYVFDSKDKGISRSYMFGYEKDNPSYEYLKTQIFLEKSENSGPVGETVYTQNLLSAKTFFLEKIKGFTHEQLEALFKKVTHQLLFNIYAISEEVDTHVAFETLNNRGKPLSLLELLKTRLIYLSTRFDAEIEEKERLRHNVNEAWKAIYHNLGRNKNKPLPDDYFLFSHFCFYFTAESNSESESAEIYTSSRRLWREYENFKDRLLEEHFSVRRLPNAVMPSEKAAGHPSLSISEINHYASSLKHSVETFYLLNNPESEGLNPTERLWLERLNRIGFSGAIPLLLALFQQKRKSPVLSDVLAAIERFNFVLGLLDYYSIGDRVNPIYVTFARKLHGGATTVDKILKDLQARTNEVLNASVFKSRAFEVFKDRGFYGWRPIRYFMYEYEQNLREKSKTSRNKLHWETLFPEQSEVQPDYVSVEHIYPRRPGRSEYWSKRFGHLNAGQRSALRDSLGNLLPLSVPKNSSLNNKPFSEKIGSDENPVGYAYGCLSENEVALVKDWGPKQIYERGIRLLSFMEKRWDIQLGDESEKAKLLGLSFMHGKK